MHQTETSGSAEFRPDWREKTGRETRSEQESQNCCRSLRSVCSGGVFTLIDRCLSLSHSLWWPPGLSSSAGSEIQFLLAANTLTRRDRASWETARDKSKRWCRTGCDHQEALWPRWSCKRQEVPQKLLMRSSGEEVSTEVCYCLVFAFVSKFFGRIRRTLHRFRNAARLSVVEQIHGLISKTWLLSKSSALHWC